jgi:hypothetical protein
MAAPIDAEAVGNAFLSYYYGMFESNRAGLVSLYQDQSMLTFMGDKFQGPAAIGQKLGALPFSGCKVTPSTTDFQPSVSGGVIVFVTGHILVRSCCSWVEFPTSATRGRADGTQSTRTPPPPTPKQQQKQTEGESQPLKFSQVFHLMPVGSSFVVTNGACVRNIPQHWPPSPPRPGPADAHAANPPTPQNTTTTTHRHVPPQLRLSSGACVALSLRNAPWACGVNKRGEKNSAPVVVGDRRGPRNGAL